MRPGGSKAKGNIKERDICRRLSRWISSGAREDLLWRSASSGGQFTAHSKKNRDIYKSQAGDISSIAPESEWLCSHFGIEVKHYGNLQIANFLYGLKSKIGEFWTTHLHLCEKVGKEPLLVVKENRRPDLLVFPLRILQELPQLRERGIRFQHESIAVLPLDEFVQAVPYPVFWEVMRRYLGDPS